MTFRFLENKYTATYFRIIEKAKVRTLCGYKEIHHIIPKSLGGCNSGDNLVALTAREHFICHRLLVRMVSGPALHKMAFALHFLTFGNNKHTMRLQHTSRTYETVTALRVIASKTVNAGRKKSAEHKAKISKTKLGVARPEHVKEKIRATWAKKQNKTSWNKGVARSGEQNMKQSATKRAKSIRYDVFDVCHTHQGTMTVLEFCEKYGYSNHNSASTSVKNRQKYFDWTFVKVEGA